MLGQALVAGLENKNSEEAKREAVEHLEKSLEITNKVMGDVSYVTVSGLQSLGSLYIKEHETVRARVKLSALIPETPWLDMARLRLLKALKAGEDILGRISLKAALTLENLAMISLYEEEMELREEGLAAGSKSVAAGSGGAAPAPAPPAPAPHPSALQKAKSSKKVLAGVSGEEEAPSAPVVQGSLYEDDELLSSAQRMLDVALHYRKTLQVSTASHFLLCLLPTPRLLTSDFLLPTANFLLPTSPLLQSSRHRDAATCHLKIADVHWLHRDFAEALVQLEAAHSIFLHIAEEMDFSGSREIAKVKSLACTLPPYLTAHPCDLARTSPACTSSRLHLRSSRC